MKGTGKKGTEEGKQRMRDKVAVDKGPRKRGWERRLEIGVRARLEIGYRGQRKENKKTRDSG